MSEWMSERTLAEVGRLVKQRMRDLGITDSRLRAATKLDRKTVNGLLDGTRWPQEDTRLKIETVLHWTAGSIQELRDGRSATPIDEDDDKTDLTHMSDDELLSELCRRLAERHEPKRDWPGQWTTPPFPGGQDPGMGRGEDNDKTGEFGGR